MMAEWFWAPFVPTASENRTCPCREQREKICIGLKSDLSPIHPNSPQGIDLSLVDPENRVCPLQKKYGLSLFEFREVRGWRAWGPAASRTRVIGAVPCWRRDRICIGLEIGPVPNPQERALENIDISPVETLG